MSYISKLNEESSPELLSEESLARELDLWANAALYFEDPPLLKDLHSQSEADYLKAPVHDFLQHGSLSPYLPILPKPDLSIVAPLQDDTAFVNGSSNSSVSDSAAENRESKTKKNLKRRNDSVDEEDKVAMEEDKRRRNTMASARFRQRKKQREAALEENAKSMSAKVESLEQKVKTLEKESKWLRSLLVEKGGLLSSDHEK
ncbi:hypothetical protein INT43_006478 [Umbelopsis isabellina]|uniref:BZIP domain-containing protein n=1 Tax=Mortierella isabellina TaxID=91625 RepID=A0A8H7UIZ0_MORIS|nr:hypothetical protein INT43_006478 [Umbelopsis isabellina]